MNVDPEANPGNQSLEGDEDIDLHPWWFASFAVPVLGATVGPIAFVFSVCALLRPWIEDLETGATVNPPNLIAVNIIQLCIAVISNFVLILGLMGQVKREIAELVSVGGFYVSSFLLTALVVAASRARSTLAAEQAWTQMYYFAVYAAVLYFVLASLMVINILGARLCGFKGDIERSIALASLLLNVVIFLSIVFLGALVFSYVEGWEYADSVYWADVTLLTVGFGDITPNTTLGRALLFPYVILGVICLGITLASVRRLVLDRSELALRKRRLFSMRKKFLERVKLSNLSLRDHDHVKLVHAESRKIQSKVAVKWKWTSFAMSLGAWFLLLFGGAGVFMRCEQVPGSVYFDGLYLAFVSLTTIGYGDLSPSSSCGRSFFVLWSLLGVPIIAIAISNLEGPLRQIIHAMTDFIKTVDKMVSRVLRAFGFGHQGKQPGGDGGGGEQRKIPATREEYCLTVLEEILGIVRHLDERPIESYSADEWVWFGEVLEGWTMEHEAWSGNGEQRQDESSGPDGRITAAVVAGAEQRDARPPAGYHIVALGKFTSESPLMGPGEEAKWFLQRLAAVLRRELAVMSTRGSLRR